MTTLTTLSELQCENWQLTAHCQGRTCGNGRTMEQSQLIARFGPDHVFISDVRIPPLLVCGRCGEDWLCGPSKPSASIAIGKVGCHPSSQLKV